MIPRFVPILEFQNVGMVEIVENSELVENLFSAVFFERFDGDVLDGLFLAALMWW